MSGKGGHLSPEEVRGLFAELIFLLEMLNKFPSTEAVEAVNDVVATAKAAGQRWAATPARERAEILNRAGDILAARRGHLMADIDPLEYKQRRHEDLDITSHDLTLCDLDRHFATGGFGGEPFLKLRKILGILRDSYCRTTGIEYMHIQDPEQRRWMQRFPNPADGRFTLAALTESDAAMLAGRRRASEAADRAVVVDRPWFLQTLADDEAVLAGPTVVSADADLLGTLLDLPLARLAAGLDDRLGQR